MTSNRTREDEKFAPQVLKKSGFARLISNHVP